MFRRAWVAVVLVFAPVSARADLTGYPLREVDRPLVAPPGLAEVTISPLEDSASRWFDADSHLIRLPDGAASSATLATISGRYGLFQGLEVFASIPWTVALDTAGPGPSSLSGSGRVELGGRYERRAGPALADGSFSLVLPSTGRRLRTDAAGTVHPDHLAVAAGADLKWTLSTIAPHASFAFVFPFANADDRAQDADPPSSFTLAAGSLIQPAASVFGDATIAFTRTNRDRIAGGVVPRSDQFRIELRPAIGWNVERQADVAAFAALPLDGRNTPQSFATGLRFRIRF